MRWLESSPSLPSSLTSSLTSDLTSELGSELRKVSFYGRDDVRNHGRDDGRSVKEYCLITVYITMTCRFYVRDVRSF